MNPSTTHGRYSRNLPARLAATYEASLADRNQLSLRPEIALIEAKLEELLGRLDTGESGASWRTMKMMVDGLTSYLNENKTILAVGMVDRMRNLTLTALADEVTWQDVRQAIHDRRLLAESERKRVLEAQQMITAEQAMTLMGAIENIITAHVHDYDARVAIGVEIERLAYIPEHSEVNHKWVDGG